jgi:hypothetical protein
MFSTTSSSSFGVTSLDGSGSIANSITYRGATHTPTATRNQLPTNLQTYAPDPLRAHSAPLAQPNPGISRTSTLVGPHMLKHSTSVGELASGDALYEAGQQLSLLLDEQAGKIMKEYLQKVRVGICGVSYLSSALYTRSRRGSGKPPRA